MLMRADAIAVLIVTAAFAIAALVLNRSRLKQAVALMLATCILVTTAGVWLFGLRLAISHLERVGITAADGWGPAWSVLGATIVKPYLVAITVWAVLLVLLALRSTNTARNA